MPSISSAVASAVSRISVRANSLRKSATRSPSAHSRPGRGRHDDRERAHQLGDRVGVQRAGAAEGDERELARVVAALDADHAQRAGHVLVDDLEDPLGGLLEADRPIASAIVPHGGARGVDVELHLAADQPRRQVADDHVGVGHRRRRAAAAVGRRAGLGARRLRPDPQRAGELRHVRDRAAARADGVHVDRRDLDPELADRGLAADRRLAGLAERDVGRRAAHVEGEDVRVAGARGDVQRAGDAAARARQHAVDRVAGRPRRASSRRRRSAGCRPRSARRARSASDCRRST